MRSELRACLDFWPFVPGFPRQVVFCVSRKPKNTIPHAEGNVVPVALLDHTRQPWITVREQGEPMPLHNPKAYGFTTGVCACVHTVI